MYKSTVGFSRHVLKCRHNKDVDLRPLPVEYLQLKEMEVINIIFLTIGLMFKFFWYLDACGDIGKVSPERLVEPEFC